MTMLDKRGRPVAWQGAILELGCGDRKRYPEAIGIDLIDYECVDIVGDVCEVLKKIPPSHIRAIYSHHFIEHVHDVPKLMDLLGNVMQSGGVLSIVVPHFSNPYYYSDPTHKSFFGLYTFSYFSIDKLHRRKVPCYGQNPQFELQQVRLVFKSTPPFFIRYALKKVLQYIFNVNYFMRELYEELFCYLFPCYEIVVIMKKVDLS